MDFMSGHSPLGIGVDSATVFWAIRGIAYNHICRSRSDRGMFDISQDDSHFTIKPIEYHISGCLVRKVSLYLQAKGVADGFCQKQDQGNDAAACPEIYDDIFRFNGDKIRE